MDNVHCGGNETSLADCQHGGWGQHNCGHNEDVSIVCIDNTDMTGISKKPQETFNSEKGYSANIEQIIVNYITLQNKFVIRQIQKCPTAKYIVHLKCTVK